MNKKVIVHFTKDMTGKSDGVLKVIETIISSLPSDEYSHIIAHEGRTEVSARLNAVNVKECILSSITKRIPLKTVFQFYALVQKNDVTIIHTHALKPLIIALIVNVLLRKKMIHHYHGFFVRSQYYNKIEQKIYILMVRFLLLFAPRVRVFVPHSANEKILYDEFRWFSEIVEFPIGQGIPKDIQLEQKIVGWMRSLKRSGKLIIGFVGRLDEEKRFDRCLRIFNEVAKENNVVLLVMGDGQLENSFKSIIGNRTDIYMLGYVPDAGEYIGEFDLLMVTSDREGLPSVIWEAMSVGTAIISTDVGAIPSLLQKHDCGDIFPKDNEDLGVELLKKYLLGQEMRENKGKGGKKAIHENYNSEHSKEIIRRGYEL